MKKQRKQKTKKTPTPPTGTVSGDEAKRRMAKVNSDYQTVFKIMTEPGPAWEPQPSTGQEPWRFVRRRGW